MSPRNFSVFLRGLPFGLPLTPGLNLVASPAPGGPRKPVFDITAILRSHSFHRFHLIIPCRLDGKQSTIAAGTGETTKGIECARAVLWVLRHSGGRVFRQLQGATGFDLFDASA
jgi:hypothetical protein